MTVSLLYKVAWRGAVRPVDAARRDTAKDVELLAPRRENAVLRRQIAGPLRRRPVPVRRSVRADTRRRWREVFSVTPTALLAWHRRFVAVT
ncbi:integrase [Streptomyces sp. INA 01156]